MNTKEFLKATVGYVISKLVAHKVAAFLLALLPTLLSAYFALESYLSKYLSDPSGKLGLQLSIAIIGLILTIVFTYFYFKPKLIISQDDGGCWLDVKTGIRYCVSCKVIHNQLIPLTQESDRFRCKVKDCNACYWLPVTDIKKTQDQIEQSYSVYD